MALGENLSVLHDGIAEDRVTVSMCVALIHHVAQD